MTRPPTATIALAIVLAVTLIGGVGVAARPLWRPPPSTRLVAYFDTSTGIYPGDDVLILGVRVGKIETIEAQPQRARITFTVDRKYHIPTDVRAVIISPRLVTSRAIQLTPAYTGGPQLGDNAVIPQDRTAVPMEYDDLRVQLQKLSDSLQPTEPGKPSPLGAFINTTADNLRGQGDQIRAAIIQLSQAISAFGDHSDDVFGTIKDLSVLVSALQSSTTLMRTLNTNFAAVTGLLANDPDELGQAIADLDAAVGQVSDFVAENKEPLGVTVDKLSSISTALVASLDDIKQTLHLAPNVLANLNNTYRPALGGSTGIPVINNFSNPIGFICGAVQAASRLGAEQAAKLCAQYLAPIVKNRQYNFPPIGTTIGLAVPIPVVGAMARPNELTYSEDWMRPDYRPTPPAPDTAPPPSSPATGPALAAEVPAPNEPITTDPAEGLPGLMIPQNPAR
ncbi:MCE family protein [Mycolicibacterium moriokaense]|uniref:Phospholipid/cholesterol/gamma-HCH transport system substrate-binding protein n=1 Tax=Mycolicibacterium moriokaense TaxID=39691 RepID=A0A318H6W3_9MYCO|nr:MCE family protein [Mycolicibacterium moriokaense]PXX00368.1 phospholipid/cholesterol/gamma-HCH transport system substrate-binding protein [Mycolicibacterium moriokaense]